MENTEHTFALDRQSLTVLGVATAWFAVALALVSTGSLSAGAGEPPLEILLAAMAPVLAFLGWYRASASFRAWVLGLDLRLLTMLQGWRVLGGMFVVLMTFGLLPGLFAWPAGLGDVAVGVTAPAVALALLRRPDFAARTRFLVWNSLGILDFVVAVGTGVMTSSALPALSQGVTSAAMNSWPLGMIPGFLVPLFTMMHFAAILQALRLRRGLTRPHAAGTVAA